MKQCYYCRENNQSGNRFCVNCGAKFEQVQPIELEQNGATKSKIKVTIVKERYNNWKLLLSVVFLLFFFSMLAFLLMKPDGYHLILPMSIENKELNELMRQSKGMEDNQLRFDLFVKITQLEDISAKDYIAASRKLNDTFYKIGVLSWGYEKTKDGSLFDEMERISSVENIINHQDNYQNIYSIIFGKPLSNIKWEDMYRIKYVNQDSGTQEFTYSYFSPYLFGTREEFEKTCETLRYRNTDYLGYYGYVPLIGCQELITTVNLVNGDIIGKPLRKVVASVDSDTLNSVEAFGAAPYLEDLELKAREFQAGDLSKNRNLRRLYLKAWIFAATGGPYKEDFTIDALNRAPQLEEVYLEDYHLVEEGITNVANLEKLTFKNCNLMDVAQLKGTTSVKALSLEGCNLKSLDFINAFPNLETLRIWGKDAAEPLEGDLQSKKLINLELDGTVEIEPFLANSNLKSLSIGDSEDLLAVGTFTLLEELNLSGNSQVYNLKLLPFLKYLSALEIRPTGNYLDNGLENLTELTKFPALRHLTFENMDAVQGMDEFISKNRLETLVIRNMTFYCTEQAFLGCDRLRELTINGVQLDSEKGEELLAAIGQLKGLRYLDLSDTMVGDLSFMEEMDDLTDFTARGNFIEDDSVLRALPSLRNIDLKGNPLENLEE